MRASGVYYTITDESFRVTGSIALELLVPMYTLRGKGGLGAGGELIRVTAENFEEKLGLDDYTLLGDWRSSAYGLQKILSSVAYVDVLRLNVDSYVNNVYYAPEAESGGVFEHDVAYDTGSTGSSTSNYYVVNDLGTFDQTAVELVDGLAVFSNVYIYREGYLANKEVRVKSVTSTAGTFDLVSYLDSGSGTAEWVVVGKLVLSNSNNSYAFTVTRNPFVGVSGEVLIYIHIDVLQAYSGPEFFEKMVSWEEVKAEAEVMMSEDPALYFWCALKDPGLWGIYAVSYVGYSSETQVINQLVQDLDVAIFRMDPVNVVSGPGGIGDGGDNVPPLYRWTSIYALSDAGALTWVVDAQSDSGDPVNASFKISHYDSWAVDDETIADGRIVKQDTMGSGVDQTSDVCSIDVISRQYPDAFADISVGQVGTVSATDTTQVLNSLQISGAGVSGSFRVRYDAVASGSYDVIYSKGYDAGNTSAQNAWVKVGSYVVGTRVLTIDRQSLIVAYGGDIASNIWGGTVVNNSWTASLFALTVVWVDQYYWKVAGHVNWVEGASSATIHLDAVPSVAVKWQLSYALTDSPDVLNFYKLESGVNPKLIQSYSISLDPQDDNYWGKLDFGDFVVGFKSGLDKLQLVQFSGMLMTLQGGTAGRMPYADDLLMPVLNKTTHNVVVMNGLCMAEDALGQVNGWLQNEFARVCAPLFKSVFGDIPPFSEWASVEKWQANAYASEYFTLHARPDKVELASGTTYVWPSVNLALIYANMLTTTGSLNYPPAGATYGIISVTELIDADYGLYGDEMKTEKVNYQMVGSRGAMMWEQRNRYAKESDLTYISTVFILRDLRARLMNAVQDYLFIYLTPSILNSVTMNLDSVLSSFQIRNFLTAYRLTVPGFAEQQASADPRFLDIKIRVSVISDAEEIELGVTLTVYSSV